MSDDKIRMYDVEQDAISELRDRLNDLISENKITDIDQIDNEYHNELCDIVFECADSGVPVYTSDILQLAADNIDLATSEPDLGPAFDGSPTPVNIIAANIFEAIEDCLWTYIRDDLENDRKIKLHLPLDPEKPEFYLTPSHYAGKLRWMITDEEMDSEFEECDSFWDAFNWCVQWAIDNNSDSLTVNFEVFESDVKQAESLKAKSLIERQHSRNTPAIKCAACKGTGGDVPYTGADCPICGGSGWESNLTLD